jgi:hypothetical protein
MLYNVTEGNYLKQKIRVKLAPYIEKIYWSILRQNGTAAFDYQLVTSTV